MSSWQFQIKLKHLLFENLLISIYMRALYDPIICPLVAYMKGLGSAGMGQAMKEQVLHNGPEKI